MNKEMTVTKAEVWVMVSGLIVVMLMFIGISFYTQYLRDQRDEYKTNAQKYEVIKPIVDGGGDIETVKKVLKALEKSE